MSVEIHQRVNKQGRDLGPVGSFPTGLHKRRCHWQLLLFVSFIGAGPIVLFHVRSLRSHNKRYPLSQPYHGDPQSPVSPLKNGAYVSVLVLAPDPFTGRCVIEQRPKTLTRLWRTVLLKRALGSYPTQPKDTSCPSPAPPFLQSIMLFLAFTSPP